MPDLTSQDVVEEEIPDYIKQTSLKNIDGIAVKSTVNEVHFDSDSPLLEYADFALKELEKMEESLVFYEKTKPLLCALRHATLINKDLLSDIATISYHQKVVTLDTKTDSLSSNISRKSTLSIDFDDIKKTNTAMKCLAGKKKTLLTLDRNFNNYKLLPSDVGKIKHKMDESKKKLRLLKEKLKMLEDFI